MAVRKYRDCLVHLSKWAVPIFFFFFSSSGEYSILSIDSPHMSLLYSYIFFDIV
jgi:hypothetical protein